MDNTVFYIKALHPFADNIKKTFSTYQDMFFYLDLLLKKYISSKHYDSLSQYEKTKIEKNPEVFICENVIILSIDQEICPNSKQMFRSM